MSFAAEVRSIETWFSTRYSETGVQYANVRFDPSELSEWARLTISPGGAKIASIGSDDNLYRHTGVVTVQIFVTPNSGATRALHVADIVSDILRSAKIDNIQMFAPSVERIGVIDGWYQINVECNYYRDSYLARAS